MCIVYSSFLGHQTSLIAFFAQTLAEAPTRASRFLARRILVAWSLAATGTCNSLRDGVAASADGLIVQQSQR